MINKDKRVFYTEAGKEVKGVLGQLLQTYNPVHTSEGLFVGFSASGIDEEGLKLLGKVHKLKKIPTKVSREE